MKVLITTFTFFPNKDGVAIACASLCNVLVKSGHKVHVATSRVAGTKTTEIIKGVSIRRFAIYISRLSDSSDQEKASYIRYLIKEDFDLIINQNWDSWTTELFLNVSRVLRAKRILVSHGLAKHIFRFHRKPFWGLGQWFRGLLWSFSYLPRLIKAHNHFVFLNDHPDLGRFLDVAICRLFVPKQIHFIANSISDLRRTKVCPFPRRRRFLKDRFLLVCVANFCQRKDQIRAIRVFAAAGVPHSSLIFIGSEKNAYSQLMRREANSFQQYLFDNNQSVHIFTGVSRKRIFETISSADAFLLTAKEETMPLVLIESMALKKPWVSTISGCIDKMEGGLPCHTDDQLIKAIRKISLSKQLRKNLAAKGARAFAKNYSSEAFSLRWKKLIEQILLPQHPESEFLS